MSCGFSKEWFRRFWEELSEVLSIATRAQLDTDEWKQSRGPRSHGCVSSACLYLSRASIKLLLHWYPAARSATTCGMASWMEPLGDKFDVEASEEAEGSALSNPSES
jgi:hypothetical protein